MEKAPTVTMVSLSCTKQHAQNSPAAFARSTASLAYAKPNSTQKIASTSSHSVSDEHRVTHTGQLLLEVHEILLSMLNGMS
jgi:hypothetical protein